MVDQTTLALAILGFLLSFSLSTTQQAHNLTDSRERLALIQLRSSLGLRTKDWPIKPDPCLFWRGIECNSGHIIKINISGFRRTRVAQNSPQFSVDALSNFTFLSYFNASHFSLPGEIPDWFGERLLALQVLDLRSCLVKGPIPSSLGNLSNLIGLYLSDNQLSGLIPTSLGQLSSLSALDLAKNGLTGSIPSSFASLTNLTLLDLSGNYLSGMILSNIGTFSKLQRLNLSSNGLSSSIPPQLGDLSNLIDLDLSSNSLSGPITDDFSGLRNLQKMVIGGNSISGSLPNDLFRILNKLQIIELNNNYFTGDLPDVLWTMPELLFLDVSSNYFSVQLPNLTFRGNVTNAVLNISNNMLYGGLTSVLERFSFVNISGNYFEGNIPDYVRKNSSLDRNCLRNSTSQRSGSDCSSFYLSKGLVFDNFGLPNILPPPPKGNKKNKKWIIVGGVVGGVLFIALLVLIVVCMTICIRKKGATNQRGISMGQAPGGGSTPPPVLSLDLSSLGEAFTFQQILLATDNFNEINLIKKGHSGDLFRGILEGGVPVVIKKIDLASAKKDSYKLELDFFSKVSHIRLVTLLGHCLENEHEKFLVYKYIPNGDLSSSLYKKTNSTDDSLQSLDWITRLKIAIGAAEGLSYLHHECSPPFVHRDVQASSILLDDKFEVRLGSLSEVCVQEGDTHQSMFTRLLRLPTTSEQSSSGSTSATCAYDVYCFGKVLLELVTGKLGISASNEANMKDYLESTMPYISIYDKELIQNIVDPSLIIDEDLLEEVWAMAIVARSCLNPKPTRRPLMRYILKALENPLKVVREDHSGEARLRTASSRGSWNAALFGSWRQSSSEVAAASGGAASKGEGGMSSLRRSGGSNSQESGQNGGGDRSSSTRRQSKEVFPEPSDEEREYVV